MDQEFVSRALGRVTGELRSLSDLVAANGGGTKEDLCDIAVARVFARALAEEGASAEELAAAAEFLQRASDVMSFHRLQMEFSGSVDRFSWNYTNLFFRLLGLAFGEQSSFADGFSEGGRNLDMVRNGPGALEKLSREVTIDAVDRLFQALVQAGDLTALMVEPSPFADDSARLLQALGPAR